MAYVRLYKTQRKRIRRQTKINVPGLNQIANDRNNKKPKKTNYRPNISSVGVLKRAGLILKSGLLGMVSWQVTNPTFFSTPGDRRGER